MEVFQLFDKTDPKFDGNNNGSDKPTAMAVFPRDVYSKFDSLLARNYQHQVPEGYSLRSLQIDDYGKGYMELLEQLTSTGSVTREQFEKRFNLLADSGSYFIVVLEDNDKKRIVGSATLVLEWKFIHECGARGRVEDVVVDISCRGKSFGKLLIFCLSELAHCHFGVYKVSLECKDKLIPFYEQFGYKVDQGNNFLVQRFCD